MTSQFNYLFWTLGTDAFGCDINPKVRILRACATFYVNLNRWIIGILEKSFFLIVHMLCVIFIIFSRVYICLMVKCMFCLYEFVGFEFCTHMKKTKCFRKRPDNTL